MMNVCRHPIDLTEGEVYGCKIRYRWKNLEAPVGRDSGNELDPVASCSEVTSAVIYLM